MNPNDLEALKASFRAVRTTAARLQEMEPALDSVSADSPPADLIRAATAHAIAAGAFSGLLHRLFTPGGQPPGKTGVELTNSAGESAT
jgi:hypothetical protein